MTKKSSFIFGLVVGFCFFLFPSIVGDGGFIGVEFFLEFFPNTSFGFLLMGIPYAIILGFIPLIVGYFLNRVRDALELLRLYFLSAFGVYIAYGVLAIMFLRAISGWGF